MLLFVLFLHCLRLFALADKRKTASQEVMNVSAWNPRPFLNTAIEFSDDMNFTQVSQEVKNVSHGVESSLSAANANVSSEETSEDPNFTLVSQKVENVGHDNSANSSHTLGEGYDFKLEDQNDINLRSELAEEQTFETEMELVELRRNEERNDVTINNMLAEQQTFETEMELVELRRIEERNDVTMSNMLAEEQKFETEMEDIDSRTAIIGFFNFWDRPLVNHPVMNMFVQVH